MSPGSSRCVTSHPDIREPSALLKERKAKLRNSLTVSPHTARREIMTAKSAAFCLAEAVTVFFFFFKSERMGLGETRKREPTRLVCV